MNDNNDNTIVNTILIVVILLLLVGGLVWFLSSGEPAEQDTGNEDPGLDVDVSIPDNEGSETGGQIDQSAAQGPF